VGVVEEAACPLIMLANEVGSELLPVVGDVKESLKEPDGVAVTPQAFGTATGVVGCSTRGGLLARQFFDSEERRFRCFCDSFCDWGVNELKSRL